MQRLNIAIIEHLRRLPAGRECNLSDIFAVLTPHFRKDPDYQNYWCDDMLQDHLLHMAGVSGDEVNLILVIGDDAKSYRLHDQWWRYLNQVLPAPEGSE